jgi:hypothetical protein
MKMNNYYSTTDLYLAVYLSCKEYNIVVTKKDKGQCSFKFEMDDNFKQIVSDYYNNSQVNVLDFKNKLRDLKSEIINITRPE